MSGLLLGMVVSLNLLIPQYGYVAFIIIIIIIIIKLFLEAHVYLHLYVVGVVKLRKTIWAYCVLSMGRR
jgi:hypothetical protein